MLFEKDQFNGKIILISGASSGIGKATAIMFAKLGAIIITSSKDEDRGNVIEMELQKYNKKSRWIQTDIQDHSSIQQLFDSIKEEYGTIDIAFNNASAGGGADLIHKYDIDDWMATINGTLTSVFLFMKYELELMSIQKSGVITNNSSVDGLRGFPMDPGYSAAKHAILGLTKSAAIQYANQNIRINAICPGWVDTPPVQRYIEYGEQTKDEILQHQPIGRLGTPEEIANLVIWLSSSLASFMTGASIPVDGGYTAV